jgi:hypothetical protein
MTGDAVIERLGGKEWVRVTKARPSGLSWSTIPVVSGWRPMMYERRFEGIRLNGQLPDGRT